MTGEPVPLRHPERRAAPLQRWGDEVAIASLLVLLAATLAFGGWAWRLDRLVYDFGLALWTRPPPPDIVIVAIDDASVAAIGRWPWRRAVHASLLQQLAAAGPRAIALDLVLSEADPDPNQDAVLAAALRQAAPVVLPLPFQAALGPGEPPSALRPAAALRGAALLGASEATVDSDGVMRHAFLYAGPPSAPLPHLALALLQAAGEAPRPGLPVESDDTLPDTAAGITDSNTDSNADGAATAQGWQRADRFLIRYTGPPGHVQRVSYVDVLRGAVPPAVLHGRYLLVGMTAQGLGDTLATPVNGRREAMPGIEVLANVLYTLRSGDTVRAVPAASTALLAAGLLVALVFGLGIVGARGALPLALGSVPLALLASLLALRSGLWCNPVPYALPALLAYPLWSWRRLERAVSGLDREIARFAQQPLLLPAAPDRSERRRITSPTAMTDRIDQRLVHLQRASAVLRQAGRFLSDTLGAMPTAMLVADANARVLLANARAAALFDLESADELQGLDLLRLLGEFETAAPIDWGAAIAALPEGEPLAVEVQRRPNGGAAAGSGERALVVQVSAVSLQDERRLIVGLTDVEAVKVAEREREAVLAFVSHDLRSPASSIVLLADLNLQGALQTGRDELLREVRGLAGGILALSEDFVRGSRATAAASGLPGAVTDTHAGAAPMAPVALAALMDAALAELRPQALAAGVGMALSPVDAALQVQVDRSAVTRALGNLVRNAIRHAPRGSTVEVEAACHGPADAPRLRLQVRDHGPGFSALQLQQLAQGVGGASVGHAQGTGLGLRYVQQVARLHGGTLVAEVAPGGGALLTLDLAA